jgi:hypothetical protein
VILLAFAAVLPGVFWDGAPDTAPSLKEAGVRQIYVAPSQAAAWRSVDGITAEAIDLLSAIKLKTPAVNYRYEQASASRVPWLDSNGWRFLRAPQGRFYYDATDAPAALAAAEAFAWHGSALVKTDVAGLKPLADMLTFLRTLGDDTEWKAVADFGFIDDGTVTSGEVMNLLVRGNLLFRSLRAPDRNLKMTVQLGTSRYPLERAKNPSAMAQMIRADLTDDKRSLRIYGSAVVVGRVESAPGRVRVHLLNYDTARKVNGIRIRVEGEFPRSHAFVAGTSGAALLDYAAQDGATEFTLPELKTYAVIDLSR